LVFYSSTISKSFDFDVSQLRALVSILLNATAEFSNRYALANSSKMNRTDHINHLKHETKSRKKGRRNERKEDEKEKKRRKKIEGSARYHIY